MATPDLAPPRPWVGIVSVWAAALVGGIAIGVFVPGPWRAEWMTVALGASLLLAFVVQLIAGRSHGFIRRVALSVIGAVVVLGLIGLGFGVAALAQL